MFERTKDIKLSIIKQMELRASQYPDVISLAQGIPSFDTPSCIKRRVENALKRGVVAKYSLTPGLPELRELIEISLAKENMFYDWQKEIIITVGTIEAITASIFTVTNPGDEIIIPSPTYTSYQEVIRLAGCVPVFVPLNEEKGWAFEIDEFKKVITSKTRIIFYCNPNNPTGTIYAKDQLLELAELAKEHDLYILTDEVYKDFIYLDNKKQKFFSIAEIGDMRKKIIRTYGFSKAYAMTGWRVGFVHSDESIITEIIKVHDALVTCAPVISQYAAMGAIEMGDEDIEKFNVEYRARRDLICARLDNLKNVFSYTKPNSSYFVFPRINDSYLNFNNHEKGSASWQFVLDLLEKTQVALVPGIAFGPNGENHVRMSFGRSIKDINKAFDRIENYLK